MTIMSEECKCILTKTITLLKSQVHCIVPSTNASTRDDCAVRVRWFSSLSECVYGQACSLLTVSLVSGQWCGVFVASATLTGMPDTIMFCSFMGI